MNFKCGVCGTEIRFVPQPHAWRVEKQRCPACSSFLKPMNGLMKERSLDLTSLTERDLCLLRGSIIAECIRRHGNIGRSWILQDLKEVLQLHGIEDPED